MLLHALDARESFEKVGVDALLNEGTDPGVICLG